MIAITRLAIFCTEKMQDFQNPHSDWRARNFSKSVQTDWQSCKIIADWQSCKIIVGQQEGGGQGGIVAWEATTFFIKSTIIRI